MKTITHEMIRSALDRAVEKVHAESRRTGRPIVFMKDGELVREVPASKRSVSYADLPETPSAVVSEEPEV